MSGSSEDDRLLIERYLAGDPSAVRTLDEWLEVVLREDFRSLREDWEDLRQEIRARIVRNFSLGAFNGHSALRTYIHRISRNVAIDFSRRAYRRREIRVNPSDPHSPLAMAGPSSLGGVLAKDLLDQILARVSQDDRSLLRLVFELHYSYEEVGRELGIPEGTVKSRMSRCKDRVLKLRRELAMRE
ncbi:MAG TPA: RNA polymerase sigma factor [Candidatus Polarisedimenticolia bacterium]|nr:RNA polymerase sigma factor [Candidatus Polarisedimenticolia bacterium]